ncbi:MAG: hypothetical protein WBG63_03410, partial [Phormidesmis sp.]
MPSIKASPEGLVRIRQAIAERGWRVHDNRWLVAASKLLCPDDSWQLDGPYAYGCSLQTWERFLRGTAIRDRTFLTFCQVLGISYKEVADLESQRSAQRSDRANAALQKEERAVCFLLQELLMRVAELEHRMEALE